MDRQIFKEIQVYMYILAYAIMCNQSIRPIDDVESDDVTSWAEVLFN